MPGEFISGFRITQLVAEGAMGRVYLAVDEALGRRVALKFVRGVALDAKRRERFREEARVTARFAHPHIVTVYSAGVHQDRPWLALEYLDGETLRQRFDEGPMPALESMRVLKAVAEGLGEAHRHGVVHADLKPENVLIPRDGRVRVVDFGLARLADEEATAASGTPAYMAPERWRGAAPAPAIDVWSLGLLLHEAIEGRRPLSESDLVQLAYSTTELQLGSLVLGSPCASLIAECLRVDPNERPSANDVATRLERLLVGRESAPVGRSPFRGLEAFTEADAIDFHGRTRELDAIIEHLRHEPFVPVVGPSGVGKSSFVFAGVLPRLKESGTWEIRSLRPGRKPWHALATALGCDPEGLAAHPGALTTELRRRSSKGRALLFIDQFEEMLTLADDRDRLGVLEALALAAAADEPWRIIVTLRSDFLGPLMALEGTRPSLSSAFVLHALGRAALEEAVRAPLRRVGFSTDAPSLPARIAAELEGATSALPLLQFTCQALWDRRDEGRKLLIEREYEAMGGAAGALASHAQRLVTELLPAERRSIRALLLRLVNPDGTRRPRSRTELLHGQSGSAALLDRLVAQRLVVGSTSDDGVEVQLELAHESLVSAWPQLQRWILETEEARTLLHDIEQAAQLWDKRGRRDAETWTDEALAEVQRRLDKWNLSLTTLPSAFLVAGRQRHERLRRRNRIVVTVVISILTIVAGAFGFAAFKFREKEQQAIAQQEAIRLAAGDIGRFELVLEPFEWDPVTSGALNVDARELPALDVIVHLEGPVDTVPGEVDRRGLFRRGPARFEERGRHEIIDAPAAGGWFEFINRGRGGAQCASSWLHVRRLPGFRERDEGRVVTLKVPTCAASNAASVVVAAGPFWFNDQRLRWDEAIELPAFRIDRYELTVEQVGAYALLDAVTLDETPAPIEEFVRGRRNCPASQLDADLAERICRFFGKRLPNNAQWEKAARGGIWLDASKVIVNPLPLRETTWGTLEPTRANLALTNDGNDYLPVGSYPDDVSPYGVFDLTGSVTEWTSDVANLSALGAFENSSLHPKSNSLRLAKGGNWLEADLNQAGLHLISKGSGRSDFGRTTTVGARCVSDD